MHRLSIRATAASVALVAFASVASAQFNGHPAMSEHRVAIGVGGGMSVPVSDAKSAFENGVNGQGFVLIRLGPLPALRFNVGYQRFDFKDQVLSVRGRSEILSGVGGLSIDLLRGPIRPYVTAGVGAFNVKEVTEAGAAAADESSNLRFGVDGGAGLSIRFGPFRAFAEGKVQNVYTKEGGFIDTKSIRTVPVSFGLLVGF